MGVDLAGLAPLELDLELWKAANLGTGLTLEPLLYWRSGEDCIRGREALVGAGGGGGEEGGIDRDEYRD